MTKGVAAASIAALFPGADAIIHVIPVSADYRFLIKIPTFLICVMIVWLFRKFQKKKAAVMCIFAGTLLISAYLAASAKLLYFNSLVYRSGDNSVVGLWPTDYAKDMMRKNQWDRLTLHSHYAPHEWGMLYSNGSQLSSVAILALLYCSSFGLLTLGFKSLDNPVFRQPNELRRVASGA